MRVVEGSAVEALPEMMTFIQGRPQTFQSVDDAVAWAISTGQTINPEAARVGSVASPP